MCVCVCVCVCLRHFSRRGKTSRKIDQHCFALPSRIPILHRPPPSPGAFPNCVSATARAAADARCARGARALCAPTGGGAAVPPLGPQHPAGPRIAPRRAPRRGQWPSWLCCCESGLVQNTLSAMAACLHTHTHTHTHTTTHIEPCASPPPPHSYAGGHDRLRRRRCLS